MNICLLLTTLALALALNPDIPSPETFRLIQAIPELQEKLAAALPGLDLRTLTGNAPSPCLVAVKESLNHFLHSQSALNLVKNSGLGLNELGDYKGCKDGNGKYFTLDLVVAKMGLCLPRECQQEDLDAFRERLFDILKNLYKEHDIESYKPYINFVDVEKKNSLPLTKGVYVTLVLSILCLLAGIGASIVDSWLSPSALGPRMRSALASFNLFKSAKQLFLSVNRVDPNLDVLNGVRTLAMGWVVFGHMLSMLNTAPFLNVVNILSDIQSQRKYVIYLSADLSVDVFFCFTGFLGILVATEQLRGPLLTKLKYIPLIYLHRYLRLFPVYLMAILTMLYVLPYLHDGPIYYSVRTLGQTCEEKWYYHALYINNFLRSMPCGGWTWYLANDFQMYLLVPFLVLLYQFRKLLAVLVVAVLFVASIITQVNLLIYNKDHKESPTDEWTYTNM